MQIQMPIMQQDHSNLPGPGPGLGVGSGAGPGSSPGLLPGLRPGRLPGAGSGPSSGPLPGLASGSGPAPGLLPALRPARGSRLGGYNANGEGDRHGNMNHLQGFHAYPRPMPVPRGGFGQGGGDQEVPGKFCVVFLSCPSASDFLSHPIGIRTVPDFICIPFWCCVPGT